MYERAKSLLTPRKTFGQPAVPICELSPRVPRPGQMILRMMVSSPETGFRIPEELEWLCPALALTDQIQTQNGIQRQYVYVTVRSGYFNPNEFRDDVWHVDGFSMRKPHIPEQNYIWTDKCGTEVLDQKIDLPEDFDPFGHNIHQYFQDVAKPENSGLQEIQKSVVKGHAARH